MKDYYPDDPFRGDGGSVSTKSTMHSSESTRSRSRDPKRNTSSSRKNRGHRQEQEPAFDAFGFSQESAFADQSFEQPVMPQQSSSRAHRARRRASLAGPQQIVPRSQSFDDAEPTHATPVTRTASSESAPAAEPRRRTGRRSSISGGLDSLKSDLRSGGVRESSTPGSGEFKTSSNTRNVGGPRTQNIVVPMTAPEKPSGRRSGRRGSLLGAVGAVGAIVGDTVGGLTQPKGKEKLQDEPKQKTFLKDRGMTRQQSSDSNGIISSYTGDRDRRRRQGSMRKSDAKSSYSDRIMAKGSR